MNCTDFARIEEKLKLLDGWIDNHTLAMRASNKDSEVKQAAIELLSNEIFDLRATVQVLTEVKANLLA